MSETTGGEPQGTDDHWSIQKRAESSFRKMREYIDRALARGHISIIVWLGLAALMVAFAATVFVVLFDLRNERGQLGVADAFWQELVRTMDPGQITNDTAGFAIVSLVVTMLGVLLVSTLISLVNSKVEHSIERVRRGREPVNVGKGGHIVVLGWSDIGAKVIEELALAQDPEGPKLPVVVLAPMEVESVRHELMEKLDALKADHPKINRKLARRWPHLRSGSTTDPRDLDRLAAVSRAKAVIVLHNESNDGAEVSDTIRTAMAVVAACRNSAAASDQLGNERPTLVLEVRGDPGRQLELLKERLEDFGFNVLPVDSEELRDEVSAQVTRRPALSEVYQDLFNFDGNEIYLVDVPLGTTTTFQQAMEAATESVVLGLATLCDSGKVVEINLWPKWDAPVAGCKLITLAPNEKVAKPAPGISPTDNWVDRPAFSLRSPRQENLLLIGWNRGALRLLRILDRFAAAGSTVTILGDGTDLSAASRLLNLEKTWVDVGVEGVDGWVKHKRKTFDHCIVLSDDMKPACASDAQTLLTLLALRSVDVEQRNPRSVVAQICERANKYLAKDLLADDLIVGHSLTATVLAQLAVDPNRYPILHELLGHTNSIIDIVPFVHTADNGKVTFSEVSAAAIGRGEIALGWTLSDVNGSVLNPSKDAEVPLFTKGIVVLARFDCPSNQLAGEAGANALDRSPATAGRLS